jgi:membrane-bound metal-dependent hydrolase YbcI (DUF457 family)
MNPGGHIEAGWLVAHAASLDRFERRWVVAMAILCDADAVFLPFPETYASWHRTFGHNLWVWIAAPLVAGFFVAKGRRLLVLGLCYLAMASHVALDLIGTGWWGMYPLWPFRTSGTPISEILISNYIAEDTMKWIIQPALIVLFTAATVWIYVRHKRTPLEAISPRVDSLIMNFVTMPWKQRCGVCGRVALYRCDRCGEPLCPHHRAVNWHLEVRCCSDTNGRGCLADS